MKLKKSKSFDVATFFKEKILSTRIAVCSYSSKTIVTRYVLFFFTYDKNLLIIKKS